MDVSNKKANRAKMRQSIAHMPSSSRSEISDKHNATIDVSAAQSSERTSPQLSRKRTRGKSLGPGGLEALNETDGNAVKVAPVFQPKSILKPTVPLTPPKTIPTFDELRQRSTRKKSPGKNNTEALLIDFSTPGPNQDSHVNMNTEFSQDILDPFSPIKAAKSVDGSAHSTISMAEEARVRQEQKQAALQQRAARRKSMANRRVSFAPEATLHTWSVMEMVEDSTTSSASNSTRRQSALTTSQTPQQNGQSPNSKLVMSDNQSLPAKVDAAAANDSPSQPDALRRKKRRSSTMSEDLDASGDEVYSSSPSGDVTTRSSPIRIEDGIESDSDIDGDTAMSIDEMTHDTIHSQESSSSTHSSLEERLRQAASHAGTRGIEYDEYGDDVSMEIANDTVTNAFQPWAQEQRQRQDPMGYQENIDVYSPAKKANAIKSAIESMEGDNSEGITMDMTLAVGGIVSNDAENSKFTQKPTTSRRNSSARRRQSLAVDTSEDETMDFTTIAGGILGTTDLKDNDTEDGSDEEMTMEFTTALGFVRKLDSNGESNSVDNGENDTMDMTSAVGGILAPIEEQTEPQTDVEGVTMAMDMTKAVGQILIGSSVEKGRKDEIVGKPEEFIADHSLDAGSSLQVDENLVASTPKHLTVITSETGSPSLTSKSRSSTRRRSARTSQVTPPRSSIASTPQKASSVLKQATPTKQLTPLPTKAKTPERTPISARPLHRGASPKKLFQEIMQSRDSPASTKKILEKKQDLLFAQDEFTGRQTPRVILHASKPHQHLRRRSSGVGIDKEGFGSPSVTQLLARRSSIGEAALQFKLEPSQTPRLRFEDPERLAEEIDAERAEEQRRESGRWAMEQEANSVEGENITLQLKDMIDSMTPKKSKTSKLKGRKSLAVGSAKGLLGKRPMELDDEDDEETPKRLKAVSREGSPVKKVHLPKPPSKEETTGRLTKAELKALDAVTGIKTPALGKSSSRHGTFESPQQSARFREVPRDGAPGQWTSFEDKLDNVVGAIDPATEHPSPNKATSEEDKISLQQFLNMTNIHFIELNTTKRRHTMAQAKNEPDCDQLETSSSRATFIAAATTMPLLELYQHATRELKSYISTGRKIIRSIETETFAEQPALFREYIEARPDVKLVMDNQFRNGKTNARLQSKEGWYTWRSQLVDGLHSGLAGIRGDMEKDLATVENQAEKLFEVISQVTDKHSSTTQELAVLQQRLERFESIDHQALKAYRRDLQSSDTLFQEKLSELEQLQLQMQEKDEALLQAAELKAEIEGQINEASRVRDEHRGWAARDVLDWKSRADTLRQEYGWSLISAEEDLSDPDGFGVALTMTYRDTLRLFFYPSAFEHTANTIRRRSGRNSKSLNSPTAPISLTYTPSATENTPVSNISTQKRFFLQLIQGHLHTLSMTSRESATTRTVLDTISSGWKLAHKVAEEVRLLNMEGVAKVSIQGDEKLAVKLMLMCADKSRVDIEFSLSISILDSGKFSTTLSVGATAIYGPATDFLDTARLRKVQTALNREVESKDLGEGSWTIAVQGFQEWYRTHSQIMPVQNQPAKASTNGALEPVEEQVPEGSTTPKSPVPTRTKTIAPRRSPLAAKKSSVIQKKTIPVPTTRQDKLRVSQREQAQQPAMKVDKISATVQEIGSQKENVDPFGYSTDFKPPAITPEMQEAMMQRTPIKRVGALRRSPI